VGKGLSRERVLEAAVRLVDERGLEGLTMRALGRALGVEAMSLYRHVGGKADLLDGIQGAILAEMEVPPQQGPWRERLRSLCLAFRQVLLSHPRALGVFNSRPAVAPSSLEHTEAVLEVLASAGFSPEEQLYALHGLVGLIVGLTGLQLGLVEREEAEVDYAALADAHPRLSEAGRLEVDGEEELAFALDAFLRGLEARRRAARRGP
jgi:AcrR family transcriptional regulator